MARPKRKINPLLPACPPTGESGTFWRAVGYVRLSVEDSGHPGADTLDSQKALISSFIEREPSLQFCGLFCDNGHTGTNFERPEFERMMELVKGGGADCIVVKDLSRFGRNYKETGTYLERIFPFLGVRFIAVADQFDTLTAQRDDSGYIVPLKNIINEVYSKDISQKSGSALAVKQRKGAFIGSWAAYGYQKCANDRHRIEPNEDTAPVVRDIFQWRLQGMSYQAIAQRLNDNGVPSPAQYLYQTGVVRHPRYHNTGWCAPTVRELLKNEVYLGHLTQGRNRQSIREGLPRAKQSKEDWVTVRNTHTPIVSEGDFQAVQAIGKKRQEAYSNHSGHYDLLEPSEHRLRKLIYCADCQRLMTRHRRVIHRGTAAVYSFFCPSNGANHTRCSRKHITEQALIDLLMNAIQTQIKQTALLHMENGSSPTSELFHALIELVEIGDGDRVSITFRFRDSFQRLGRSLSEEAGPA